LKFEPFVSKILAYEFDDRQSQVYVEVVLDSVSV